MTTSITFRQAVPEDGLLLQLRPEDQAEADLYGRQLGLYGTIERSRWSIAAESGDGELVFVGGVADTPALLVPWLMCSSLVDLHKRTVTRELLRWRRSLPGLAKGRLVGNYVSKANTASRALLLRLGFAILPSPGEGTFDFFFLPSVPHV